MRRLAIVPLLLLAACGGNSVTGPDETAGQVTFTFTGASPAQQGLAHSLWAEQKACAGYDDRAVHVVEIDVKIGGFLCVGGSSGVWAAGCTPTPNKIQVNGDARVYENALSHEYLHLADHLSGRTPDWDHAGPVWARCDQRNRR